MARAQVSWGLDIGTTSLKAVKLARAGDKVTIEGFDVVEHERFLSEPDVDKDGIVRASLAKFMERNAIRNDLLFIGVPGAQTFARFVKLPPVEPKKVPEIVKFEAIQQIPFPLEQVNWDYQTFQSPESPDVEVGIFAMKKELVAQVLANFQMVKLATAGVQMSPLAVFNAVEFDGLTEGKGTVVLDIGAEHTDLIFIDHGRLWLRTINIGGNNFTDALAKSFRLSFHKAEELKKTAATSKYARQVYQSMRPVFADLVTEIQRSIGFYNSSHRDSRLERVIGMGNPFKLPNLQKYLAQNLSMEVIRLESFKKATPEGKLAAGLNEHILGLPAAYGLALQGLDLAAIDTNLLPKEIARQMLWRKKNAWFIAAAALLVAGVSTAAFKTVGIDAPLFAREEAGDLYRQNKEAVERIGVLRKAYSDISNTYEKDSEEVRSFVNLSRDRAIWPNILHDILASLPQVAYAKTLESPNRHDHKEIVIRSIAADYSTTLEALPAPSAGAAANTDKDALAAAAGATRGFVVTIHGYTPYVPTVSGVADRKASRDLIREFMNTIREKAPGPHLANFRLNPARPFFYDYRESPPPYTAQPVGTEIIWGGQTLGPYAAVFLPELLGVKPVPPPAPGTLAPSALPVGGAPPGANAVETDKITTPVEPGSGAAMAGDDVFTLHFSIYLVPPAAGK